MVKRSILICILILSLVLNIMMIYIIIIKTDLLYRSLAKIGLADYITMNYQAQIDYRNLEGWANTLSLQATNNDVVFYGNSITFESNFRKFFPEMKICNLGCNRDNLDDLIHRSFIIKNVHPHKIFVLGGINSIINISLDDFDVKYNALVDTIMKQNPSAQLYLQSLLPVNIEMEIGSRYQNCQDKIKDANILIRNISQSKGCCYVDLYSAYQVNDSMPRKYTRDGLHLYPEAYEIWARAIAPYMQE